MVNYDAPDRGNFATSLVAVNWILTAIEKFVLILDARSSDHITEEKLRRVVRT